MDLSKYDIQKNEIITRFNDWKESVPVVVLSDALKIVGKKHGIGIYLDEDDRPSLHFHPGLRAKDMGSARWDIADQVAGYFLAAANDLIELIQTNKIIIPMSGQKNIDGSFQRSSHHG